MARPHASPSYRLDPYRVASGAAHDTCAPTPAGAPAIVAELPIARLRHDVIVLSPEDLERFRARLEQGLASVQARIQTRTEELEGTGDPDVSDRGDEAQSIAEREQAIDDNTTDRELLGRIDRALSRINMGTYGVSDVSGKPIPIERLEALPTATTLI